MRGKQKKKRYRVLEKVTKKAEEVQRNSHSEEEKEEEEEPKEGEDVIQKDRHGSVIRRERRKGRKNRKE